MGAVWIATLLLFLYKLTIQVTTLVKTIVTKKKSSGNSSLDKNQPRKNPNIHLFVGCGGFLE